MGCLLFVLNAYATPLDNNKKLAEADSLAKAENYAEALTIYRELTETFQEKKAWDKLAHIYLWIGECLYYPAAYEEGLAASLQSEAIVKEYLSADGFAEYGMLLQNLGVFYASIGNFDKQMDYYQALFRFSLNANGRRSKEGADAFYNLGMAYLRRNQWGKTQAYLDTSLQLATELGYTNGISDALNILATCYANNGDYAKAIDFQRRALKLDDGTENRSVKLNNLAEYMLNLGQYQEALLYFEQSIALDSQNWAPKLNLIRLYNEMERYEKVEQLTDQFIAQLENRNLTAYYLKHLYNYKASIFITREDWQMAVLYSRKALAIVYDDPVKDASVLLLLAKALTGAGNLEDALQSIQDAFAKLFPEAPLASSMSNPPVTSLLKAEIALELLAMKGQILQKMLYHKQDASLLEATIALYQTAEELIAQNRQRYLIAASKSALAQSGISLYQDAVEMLYEQYQRSNNPDLVELAFTYSEKSRSLSVAERLNDIQAKVFTRLPQKWIDQENQLLGDIAFYSNKIATEGEWVAANVLNNWEEALFDKRVQQSLFLEKLSAEYPQYFDLKYQSFSLHSAQIRRDVLGEEEVLLEYFAGKTNLFLFWISPTASGMIKLDKMAAIDDKCRQFRAALLQQSSAFSGLAYQLYQSLLWPIRDSIENKSLVIIPDGVLGYVPFETLLSQESGTDLDWRAAPLVLFQHKIRYFFSAQVALLAQKITRRQAKNNILGISPGFTNPLPFAAPTVNGNKAIVEVFPPLNGALAELGALKEKFQGQFLFGKQATKQAFLAEAANYKVLHIATHTLVDDMHPNASGFVFSSPDDDSLYSFLFAYELFNQALLAELVTLSACNTGFGQIQKGEGIASLGRAFAFAGCSNLVVTLWQIKDQTTPVIINQFYENLSKGMGKDLALYAAKVHFLETYNPLFLHPYYWGGMIYVGDRASLSLQTKKAFSAMYWWPAIVLVLSFFGVLFWRRKNL